MKKSIKKEKLPLFNSIALVLPFVAFLVGFFWYKAIDRSGMEGMYSVLVVFISIGIGIAISFICAIVSLLRNERWGCLTIIELVVYGLLSFFALCGLAS